MELGIIQEYIFEMQRKSGTGVNYYKILLNEVSSVVDQLIEINSENVLNMDLFKLCIIKFEKAKDDFMSKV